MGFNLLLFYVAWDLRKLKATTHGGGGSTTANLIDTLNGSERDDFISSGTFKLFWFDARCLNFLSSLRSYILLSPCYC